MPTPFSPAVLQRAVQTELDARPVAAAAPSPVHGHLPMHWTLAGMAAGQAADAVTTYQALHRPGTEEGNSFLYGKDPSMGRLIATKAAMVGPMAWALDHLYNSKPKTAMALAGAIGSLGLIAAARNTQVGK